MQFTAICLEALNFLEANEGRLNARARRLLEWLRRRYPIRKTVYADDEIVVTTIPYEIVEDVEGGLRLKPKKREESPRAHH